MNEPAMIEALKAFDAQADMNLGEPYNRLVGIRKAVETYLLASGIVPVMRHAYYLLNESGIGLKTRDAIKELLEDYK